MQQTIVQRSILLLFLTTTSSIKPAIHAYFTELFNKEPVPTEYISYTLLKEHPIEDQNYLAVPWTILMKKKMLHALPPLQLDGGFTVCQHFRFKEIIPLLNKMGINVLFTPHVEQGVQYHGLMVLPFPHYAKNGTEPTEPKDILYSFVGSESNQNTRRAIFNLPCKKDVIIIKRKSWGAHTTEKKENKEYKNILARSRFALCPRGHGASTIRFWEALQAGAIPIVLADTMMLPPEIDWDACIIRVQEKNIHKIDKIIRSITTEQEELMRQNCLLAYELFSGKNLVSTIRSHYK